MALTRIPDDLGQGGANLAPGGAAGTPTLVAILQELSNAVAAIQAGTAGPDFVARFATTGNRTLSGVTTTNTDGVTPVAGDIALVQAQTDHSQNGLYKVASGAWTRLTDATGATVIKAGILVQVAEGSTNGDKLFVCTTDDPINVGTDNIDFSAAVTASLATSTPASLGVAATAGSNATASKSDHVHAWAQKVTTTLDDTITGSADSNGTPTSPINIGSALPARAIVVALEVKLTTPASGGSVATANLDIGWAGATQALLKQFDLVAASAGSYDQNAGSSAATKTYPVQAGGEQLQAIVTPDVNHKISALTALSVDLNVYYVVPF